MPSERTLQTTSESCFISSLAFPNNDLLPASFLECGRNLGVPLFIPGELFAPEFQIGLWCVGQRASPMPMPEAAVNVDRGAIFRQHDIGPTRHLFAIQPKPIAEAMQQ